VGRDGAGYGFDLGKMRRSLFLQSGLDRPNQIDPLEQISVLQKFGSRTNTLCPLSEVRTPFQQSPSTNFGKPWALVNL
jgi:hypothetical protein